MIRCSKTVQKVQTLPEAKCAISPAKKCKMLKIGRLLAVGSGRNTAMIG